MYKFVDFCRFIAPFTLLNVFIPKIFTIFAALWLKLGQFDCILNMRKFIILTLLVGVMLISTSCFKDEPLNTECDIEAVTLVVSQP